jgi:ribonuclease HI
MDKYLLFTDGSVNTHLRVGYGAYLLIPESELSLVDENYPLHVKRFENTSSSKLELQTLIWALNEIRTGSSMLTIYTDSQNIIGLAGRRARLEQNDYHSKQNKLLKNHELYRAFFKITDQLNCELVKVQGHLPSDKKNDIDRLFALVDLASRKALRNNQ